MRFATKRCEGGEWGVVNVGGRNESGGQQDYSPKIIPRLQHHSCFQMTSAIDRPQPSTAAIVIATAIIAALGGYFVAQGASLGIFSSNSKSGKKSWPNSYDVTVHPDSSDEELMKSLKGEEEDDEDDEAELVEPGKLASFEGNTEECKLVLVVRTDLGMGKGRINSAAKCFGRIG